MNTVFTTTNSSLNEMLKSVHGSKGQIKNSNSQTERIHPRLGNIQVSDTISFFAIVHVKITTETRSCHLKRASQTNPPASRFKTIK